jgi:hypothetical protein
MKEADIEERKALTETIEMYETQRVANSFSQQSRDERRARMHAVIALAVVLEAIRKESSFATRLGEAAIEAVIEGDWFMVSQWVEHFTWEDPQIQERYAPLWAPFVTILRSELTRRTTS